MKFKTHGITKTAAASNGSAAVLVGDATDYPVLMRLAPARIANWDHRHECDQLFAIAAAKLGYFRDKRYKQGWARRLPTTMEQKL